MSSRRSGHGVPSACPRHRSDRGIRHTPLEAHRSIRMPRRPRAGEPAARKAESPGSGRCRDPPGASPARAPRLPMRHQSSRRSGHGVPAACPRHRSDRGIRHTPLEAHRSIRSPDARERVNPPLGKRKAPARAAVASRPGLHLHARPACRSAIEFSLYPAKRGRGPGRGGCRGVHRQPVEAHPRSWPRSFREDRASSALCGGSLSRCRHRCTGRFAGAAPSG
jgi:hypothetical protein